MWTEIAVRLHLSPGNLLVLGGGDLAVTVTCLFCFLRGSRADRLGAAVFGAFWIVDLVATSVHLWTTGDPRPPVLAFVVCDLVPGLAFLWLSVRHDNLWFGAVALFQGLQFAIDGAERAIHEPIGTPLTVILILTVDALNLAMMAAMIGSTVSHMRKRRRAMLQVTRQGGGARIVA